jgi:hypothetical protein
LFPSNVICGDTEEKYKPDQALAQPILKKAKELGHNPLPMCVGKNEGIIVFFPGMTVYIAKGDLAPGVPKLNENEMVVNVGEILLPVRNLKLKKGEYAVVKGGKFIKQPGKITTD